MLSTTIDPVQRDSFAAQVEQDPTLKSAYPHIAREMELCRRLLDSEKVPKGSFLLVDETRAAERLASVKKWLPDAVVSFEASRTDPALFQMFNGLGVGFALDNDFQLEVAKRCGISAGSTYATYHSKTKESFEWIVANSPGALCIETVEEMKDFVNAGLKATANYQPVIYVRLKVSDRISDAAGRSPRQAIEVAKTIRDLGFNNIGLSLSWDPTNTDVAAISQALDLTKRTIGTLANPSNGHNVKIEHVDLGNSFACQSIVGRTDSTFDAENAFRQAAELVKKFRDDCNSFVYFNEPSRSITLRVSPTEYLLTDAGTLCTEVVRVKDGKNTNSIQVIIGEHVYGGLQDHPFRARQIDVLPLFRRNSSLPLANKFFEAETGGITCDSVDSVGKRKFPINICRGDNVVIPGVGSMGDGVDFNGYQPAGIVIVRSGDALFEPQLSPWFDRQEIKRQDLSQWLAVEGGSESLVRMNREADWGFARNKDRGGEFCAVDDVAKAVLLEWSNRFPRQSAPGSMLLINVNKLDHILDLHTKLMSPIRLFGAVKALSDISIQARQAHLGLSFDTASKHELLIAKFAGADPKKDVIISHPAKSAETVAAIFEERPWAFTVDSLEDIENLSADLRLNRDYRPVVFLRPRYTAAEAKDDLSRKYGSDPKRVMNILKAAGDLGVRDLGLMSHLGTQVWNSQSFAELFAFFKEIGIRAKENGLLIRHYDIGGGVCDSETAIKNNTSIEKIFTGIGVAARKFEAEMHTALGVPVTIMDELGRALVADSGDFYTMVTGVRRLPSPTLGSPDNLMVQVQDSLSGGLCGIWCDAKSYDFSRLAMNDIPTTAALRAAIKGGSSRESARVRSANGLYEFPDSIRRGDYLRAKYAGAYTIGAGQTNAPVVLYWQNEAGVGWDVSPRNRHIERLLRLSGDSKPAASGRD